MSVPNVVVDIVREYAGFEWKLLQHFEQLTPKNRKNARPWIDKWLEVLNFRHDPVGDCPHYDLNHVFDWTLEFDMDIHQCDCIITRLEDQHTRRVIPRWSYLFI